MKEKFVINENAKDSVQSAYLNEQEKRETRPLRAHVTSPAWQESEFVSSKRKSFTKTENFRAQKLKKKLSEKAPTRTKNAITVHNLRKCASENETR